MSSGFEMERVVQGQRVYYYHSARGWSLGTLTMLNLKEKEAEIQDEANGTTERLRGAPALSQLHAFMDKSYDPNEPELFRVQDLHVATLLYCIKERCESLALQYSRMGEMILSVNPFQQMAFNGEAECAKYLASPDPLKLDPHVWQIAHKAFTQIIVRGQGNQSVVISGESGSGKTENTKMLINYLSKLSGKHSCNAAQRETAERVSTRLKWSNPILESFGNARTVRNDNSSRFGKYTKLFFDPNSGVMVGGEMVTYLLEKSRIISVNKGERNYHVFYEMLAGLTPAEKQQLGGLKNAADYPPLSRGETFTRRGIDGRDVNDAQEFKYLQEGFTQLGISKDDQWAIYETLAAILHLQELEFVSDNNDKATITNPKPLLAACTLLKIDPEALKPCLLIKSKTKIMELQASKSEANVLRDAFCKALYVGLFDCLVKIVNSAIQPPPNSSKYIGVLDIFGFENFSFNSFEQLCINFANETLQNHYNKFTFLNDEEECRSEGIECPKINFPNNLPCLQMFEQTKTGLFALLDEECNVKTGTSQNYTSNLWNFWADKNEYFVKPRGTVPNEFSIRHYANLVNYNTDMWLEKNADALKEEAKVCLQKSKTPFIARLLDTVETVSSDGQMRKRVTVASRFQGQLAQLRGELESTETHFVRCVKPNMLAKPRFMENVYVGSQLESAGVLQTIALKRQGYPVRRTLKAFSSYFYTICPRSAAVFHRQGRYAESVTEILRYFTKWHPYTWKSPCFAVGRTKVFLRGHVWTALETILLRQRRHFTKKCAPYLIGWIERFKVRKAEEKRRREEEQKRLQQQAQERKKQSTTLDLAATGQSSGLDRTKSLWFEELARNFDNFDLPVILDVVFNLPKKEQAYAALAEMQKDRLDSALPAALIRFFDELRVRPAVVEALATRGVTSLAAVAQLTDPEMITFGMNEAEIAAVKYKMLSQQSEAVINERLRASIGEGSLEDVVKHLGTMRKANAKDNEIKIRQLQSQTGCGRELAVDALVRTNGNLDRAQEWVLSQSGRRPSNVTTMSSDVNSPTQGLPRVPSSRPTGPVGVPTSRIVPPATRPAAPSAVPSANQPQQQPTGQTPVRGIPVVASSPPPVGARPTAINPADVDKLVAMGFDRVAATNALIAANGQIRVAADRLLSM